MVLETLYLPENRRLVRQLISAQVDMGIVLNLHSVFIARNRKKQQVVMMVLRLDVTRLDKLIIFVTVKVSVWKDISMPMSAGPELVEKGASQKCLPSQVRT